MQLSLLLMPCSSYIKANLRGKRDFLKKRNNIGFSLIYSPIILRRKDRVNVLVFHRNNVSANSIGQWRAEVPQAFFSLTLTHMSQKHSPAHFKILCGDEDMMDETGYLPI